MRRRFDAVLFDLDGTLLDTRELIVESYQHTFQHHLGLKVTREAILARLGHTLVDHFGLYPNADVAAMVETYRAYNLFRHDELTTIFPGVVEALDGLAGLGCRLAVVSSKARRTVSKGLDLFQLAGYFEAVVCYEDTELHKPHPDPVTRGVSLLALAPERALMVGDSPFDLTAGRLGGTGTAAVSWSSFTRDELARESPDFFLQEMADLLAVVAPKSFP